MVRPCLGAGNGGAPLGLILISPVLNLPISWDVLIFLPPIIFGVALAIAGFVGASRWEQLEPAAKYALRIVGGLAVLSSCVAAIVFGRNVPRIPDEDDFPRIPIVSEVDGDAEAGPDTTTIKGAPQAPIPPNRHQLAASTGDTWFRDNLGRKVIFRGINVSGSSKLPMMPAQSDEVFVENEDILQGGNNSSNTDGALLGAEYSSLSAPNPNVPPSEDPFYDYKSVTFVGRPFPLKEADVHIQRLRSWGYTLFRLLFTWEAVEHDGPGVYDTEYLDYLVQIVRKCNDYGIVVFLDCHQDTWSRWTGGDGAPAWTLERIGLDITQLDDSGAAYLSRPEGSVKMAWNSNNSRLGAGTMWTLFFAGNDYAPKTMVDGERVQEWLQRHFCNMLGKVAEAVKDEPNVLGFDVLNEPSVGFIGVKDATSIADNMYLIGWRVDAWSAILLGAGYKRTVDFFSSFLVYSGRRALNTHGVCAWKDGPESCVWRQNGVWDIDDSTGKPRILNKEYFALRDGIDFQHDYTEPFWRRASKAVRKHMPDAIIFAEPVLDMTDPSKSERPRLNKEEIGTRGYVWAKHAYDGITLLTCSFHRWLSMNTITNKPVIGRHAIQKSFGKSLGAFKEETQNMGGGCPVLIGECGIPFNMRGNRKFQDMGPCTSALDNTMRAVEIGLVSCTLWNYTAENTNRFGDNWNGEDLSIFSRDHHYDTNDLNSGGRSLAAAVRPFALATAGTPTQMDFDPYRKDKRFIFSFVSNDGDDGAVQTNESLLFLPRYQYPHGANINIKDGKGKWEINWAKQTLTYRHNEGYARHTLVITKEVDGSGNPVLH